MRYKSNLDSADNRHKTARGNYNEARARTQKMQAVAKHVCDGKCELRIPRHFIHSHVLPLSLKSQAQKAVAVATNVLKKKKATLDPKAKGRAKVSEAAENERASVRVKDIIASFHKTAKKRREQLDQKRNSSASSTWVQGLPEIPGPLKKSLWHKMHRRRQQIVLRPSLESLTLGLRDTITKAIRSSPPAKKQTMEEEEEHQRAEQLFCLAMYPVAPKDTLLPSIPPSSASSSEAWAEPGRCTSSGNMDRMDSCLKIIALCVTGRGIRLVFKA